MHSRTQPSAWLVSAYLSAPATYMGAWMPATHGARDADAVWFMSLSVGESPLGLREDDWEPGWGFGVAQAPGGQTAAYRDECYGTVLALVPLDGSTSRANNCPRRADGRTARPPCLARSNCYCCCSTSCRAATQTLTQVQPQASPAGDRRSR
jgi:hypothetical protein